MIDANISLSMAVHARKGVYALLVGSGVSRAAQIPTGYEVMIDLVEQAARLSDGEAPTDPEHWFREHHGENPTYSSVLEIVARTPADRSHLLRQYFEPTEEDREAGHKTPTKAHRAIARMVRLGYFRVIVTTNFDRLLETALTDEDVRPQVLANPAAVKGMTPLQHSDCTVLKVHGDYLDLATRNTAGELASYDPELDAVLDRVFTEYGLVVCGWSGDWDEALRNVILRATRHRFSTYWMARGSLGDRAEEVVSVRQADTVTIESADDAFESLEQNLLALEERQVAHPLSAEMSMAMAKRHLADKIRLDDLVRKETKRIADGLGSSPVPTRTRGCGPTGPGTLGRGSAGGGSRARPRSAPPRGRRA